MSRCGRNHWSAWKSAVPARGQHSVTELQHVAYSCSSFIIKGFLFYLWNVSALDSQTSNYLLFSAACLQSLLTLLSKVSHFITGRPGTSQLTQDSLSCLLCSFSNFIMCTRDHQWSTWQQYLPLSMDRKSCNTWIWSWIRSRLWQHLRWWWSGSSQNHLRIIKTKLSISTRVWARQHLFWGF